jgi:predicted DCC family thiol-disulfide oxidoreductase YuxK
VPYTVLYDADCGFCRWTVAVLLRWDVHRRLRPIAIESPEGERLLRDIPLEQRLASAHVVTAEGRRASGGRILPVIAEALPGGRPLAVVGRALAVPLDWVYRWIAQNRPLLSRFVPAAQKARATERIASHLAQVGGGAAPRAGEDPR